MPGEIQNPFESEEWSTCTERLNTLQDAIERTLTPDQRVEKARIEAECFVKANLQVDLAYALARNRISDLDFNHYFLALGDPDISYVKKGNTLTDVLPAKSGTNGIPRFDRLDHHGGLQYCLYRSSSPTSRLISKIDKEKEIKISDTETKTLDEIIFSILKEPIDRGYRGEYSWILPLAVSVAQRGETLELRDTKGKSLTLRELVELELDSIANMNQFGDKWKRNRVGYYGGHVHDNLHRLNALMEYWLYEDTEESREQVEELMTFLFHEIDYVIERLEKNDFTDRDSQKRLDRLEEQIGLVSHLLTPLTHLPENTELLEKYPNAKNKIQRIVQLMSRDISWCIEAAQQESKSARDIRVSLAHALDVLNNLPVSWWQTEDASTGSMVK